MAHQDEKEFAIIGLGRFGSSVATALVQRGYSVLGIDRDRSVVQRLADELTQTAALDATNEDALREIHIASFDTVVVAIGTDFESNLMTTVAAKSLGVRSVICKALTERQGLILTRMGADKVILPEKDAGRRLALELAAPGLLDQIPLGEGHSVIELQTPRPIVGQSVYGADLRRQFGVTVVAIKRGEALTVSPSADYVLRGDDVLVVIGTNDNLARLAELG